MKIESCHLNRLVSFMQTRQAEMDSGRKIIGNTLPDKRVGAKELESPAKPAENRPPPRWEILTLYLQGKLRTGIYDYILNKFVIL